MVKQFAGVLAILLFAASMVLLLPRLVYANTGTPPTLTITAPSPAANPNPVPVGVSGTGPFTTVTFQVNVSNGNEQSESGPVTPTSQQYTINGGGGLIVSVGAPQGYTTNPTTISSAGLGSVTVTGSGSNSFELSATLFFPVSAAGNDTVTCTGALTLSDGTQVGSSPSGSVQVAAVAVDSIALIPNPSTQQEQGTYGPITDTFNYQIGEKITRSDFTITTTPTGYGDYQVPSSNDTPGPYLVTLSPESFQVAVGDNVVTATCGASSQSLDVVGANASGSWSAIAPSDGTEAAIIGLPFTAEVTSGNGGPGGTYEVAAVSGNGGIIGGDTGGSLTEGVPYSSTADLTDSGGYGGDQESVGLTVQASPPSGGGASAMAANVNYKSAAEGGAAPSSVLTGLIKAFVSVGFSWEPPQITPSNNVGNANGILLTVSTQLPYVPQNVQATASCSAGGTAFYFLAGSTWEWTDDPSATVQVQNLSAKTVLEPGVGNVSVLTESYEDAGQPITVGNHPPGPPVAYNPAAGKWGVGNQQVNDDSPGGFNGNTATNCNLSGNKWDLESDAQTASLYPPDINWTAAPQDFQTFVIKWKK